MDTNGIIDIELLEGLLFAMDEDSDIPVLTRQFKTFMDEMPGGFFIYRAGGKEEILYANAAMARIFGCSTMQEFKELTGNSFRGVVHPDDLDWVERSIVQQIAKSRNELDHVTYRILQKDGNVCWINDYGHFVRSKSLGDIFYVFIRDATEQNERELEEKNTIIKEKQLREQYLQKQIDEYSRELKVIHQEQLRRLEMIEGLSLDYESIFYVDLNENWIKAYRIGERYEKQFSQVGQPCKFEGFDVDYINTWVHPEDRKLLYGVSSPEYIRDRLSEDKTFHINYRICKGEKIVYIQLRVVNAKNDNPVSQVLLGYRNIDEEIIQEMKQMQMLTEALNEARVASRAKSVFLSNMSHDIRTPMNAIVGFTELMKRHMEDREKISDYLEMISDSSSQLLQLLNDVLEISRLESGSVYMEEAECSLTGILHQVHKDFAHRAEMKNIEFSLDLSKIRHDMVRTDQIKLAQILTYLVDNAVKYTPRGGWITLSILEKQGQSSHAVYQFIVEDSGIGISEEYLEQIFVPFEREKNTTLSGIHGMGIGLTITKNLTEMLGGTIEVSSKVGVGSKFTITIPLSVRADLEDMAEEDGAPIEYAAPKRILVVDDNEINLEIEIEVLKDAGFLVDTAEDGSIALEKIRCSAPGYYGLVLMDLQMPVMDGYHATRAIRRLDDQTLAGIPIIAVSANTFEEDKKQAMESGMNAHLAKPLDVEHLYKTIGKFLREDKQ